MKRNLLSIIILALLIVNIGMNAFLLFNVMSTNAKSKELIRDITAAIELEKTGGVATGSGTDFSNIVVGVADKEPFSLTAQQNFPLAIGDDGKSWVVQTGVEIIINKTDADYKTYGSAESLAANQNTMLSAVQDAFRSFTIDQIRLDQSALKQDVLQRISALYDGSTLIIDVNFPGFTPAEM